jgi:hypothetical protein
MLSLGAAALVAACGGSSPSTSSQAATTASTSSTSAAPAATTGTATTATTAGTARPGPEGIPLESGPDLAPAATTVQGATVDGVQCAPIEQLVYHIHSHLQVYVNGEPRALPAAIGLVGPVSQQTPYGPFYGAQQCYYWLHTHASDGVIHIESPTPRIYTLGNFFDEWGQQLSSRQVAGARGTVTATVNGKRWTKSPRSIPLRKHEVIQLAVGRPIPPFHRIDWATSQL